MTWQTWAIIFVWAITKAPSIFALSEPLTLKYKKAVVVLSYVAGLLLLFAARAYCFLYMPSIPTDSIFFVIIVPLYLFGFLRFTCRDKSMKIALFAVLIYALGIFGHILAPFIFYLIAGEIPVFDFIGNTSMYVSFIANTIEVILYLLFLFIWKRYIGKMRSDIPNVGAFLFIIGGQLIYAMNQLLVVISQQTKIDLWTVIGCLIMIIGDLAILQILLTNSKKKELEENLRETQHIRELEHMHYTAVEERRQEIAKIRHDFNNQLLAAHQLISSDKGQYAEQILDELESSISRITENVYCQNAIVNAVLTEKQKECDSAKITLETDITIDGECKISPLHLCSIFTNILDNAIRACKLLPNGQRKIELRTAIKGDYLHIKCVNPVTDRPEKGRNGKGYGKIILSDIASYYGGNFTAERIDKTYVALVSLLHSAI